MSSNDSQAEFDDLSPLLEAVGVSEAADENLDVDAVARETGRSTFDVEMRYSTLSSMGLIWLPDPNGAERHELTEEGRQYLAAKGDFAPGTLSFLPRTISDLHAREALLLGGDILIDMFRHQMLNGSGIGYTQDELVPGAFRDLVDDRMVLQLFAAGVALMARLAENAPASCVGEEMMAVNLIESAGLVLGVKLQKGEITDQQHDRAEESFRALFGLFEDDDVLRLFDMQEPADAAVLNHTFEAGQLGVVDLRPVNWFAPFGPATPTGYFDDRST